MIYALSELGELEFRHDFLLYNTLRSPRALRYEEPGLDTGCIGRPERREP